MDEVTIIARALEKDRALTAEKEMVEKHGVTIVDIDKTPFVEKTRPFFDKFGIETGTTDMINAILNLK